MPEICKKFARNAAILVVVASWNCLACSAATKRVARDATPVAVDAGIEAGLSDKNQEAVVRGIEPERVERGTEKLAAGAADGWIDAMDQDERKERMTAALSPMVAALVNDSVETALSDEHLFRVRELAKQATLGFQDAIDEVAEQREEGSIPSEKGNVLEAVDRVAESGGTALSVLGALAALLAVLLGIGVVWALGRRRRYDRESAGRDRALEATAPMLSRDGLPLAESKSARTDEPADQVHADADAELVRSATRRLGPTKDDGSTKTGTRGERHS